MSSFLSRVLNRASSSGSANKSKAELAQTSNPVVDTVEDILQSDDAQAQAQRDDESPKKEEETSEDNVYSRFNNDEKTEPKPVTFVINKGLDEADLGKHVGVTWDQNTFFTGLVGGGRGTDGSRKLFTQRLASPGIENNQPEQHGLLGIAYKCYNEHLPLVLSPDDVWIAIMTQFSFWMKDNAKAVRSHFVSSPEGKQTLKVELNEEDAEQFGTMVSLFEQQCHENILDKEFAAWASPTFSTTTATEKTVYAGILMASLSEYFSYVAVSRCGIPRVVIRGNRADWESILARIDKLKCDFGLKSWANQLTHVVEKFIQTLDGKGDASFWNKIISRKSRGSGKSYFSGWITCFNRYSHKDGKEIGSVKMLGGGYKDFPVIDSFQMTNGYAEVDIRVENPAGVKLFDAQIILGLVGMQHDKEHNAIGIGRGWGWGSVQQL